jgi:peptidoglycan L-alanyl-D-glutamate endopeptidase CwlK
MGRIMITLGKASLAKLDGVHPDLVRVVKHAAGIATPAQDFTMVQGVRSAEECCVNWGKGRSATECTSHGVDAKYALPSLGKVTWLANPFGSKHCRKGQYGEAVDMAPYPIDWNDLGRFKALAVLMKKAAKAEGVAIVWGGDWKTSKDYPHFELA